MKETHSIESAKKTSNRSMIKNKSEAVPDFIQKLFRMLENQAFQDVFCWSPSGTTFLVKDTNEFSKTILPKHFKHCNFASFVRQLNKYDFHKIRNNAEENQKLYGDQIWEFEHLYFQKDRKDLLEEIRRKTPGRKKQPNSIPASPSPAPSALPPPPTESPLSCSMRHSEESSEELMRYTRELQSQLDQLKQTQTELESTLEALNQKEKLILTGLSGLQNSLRTKDQLIQDCLELKNSCRPSQDLPSSVLSSIPTTPTTPAIMNTPTSATNMCPSVPPPPPSVLPTVIQEMKPTDLAHSYMYGTPSPTLLTPPTPPVTSSLAGSMENKGKQKMVHGWAITPRVLLVDDDSVYRNVCGRMLTMAGCSMDVAKDGLEALERLSTKKYDLILMDIVMPKMDGISTTRNIRRFDSLTPIVSMTSNYNHNDIMEYIGIGMNDILPKPFSKNTLYDILDKHCAHLKAQPSDPMTNRLLDETNYRHTTSPTTNNTPPAAAAAIHTPTTSPTTHSWTMDNRKLWSKRQDIYPPYP
ncbi:hypothetical protein EDC96DRAFT_549028 [Choanephora cucurbitarum]|nr:hypothetical protein EDC96DRAFT_549028 [Choanephora cucurbitarum]